MPSIYVPHRFTDTGGWEERHLLHHLGKKLVALFDFTLITAIFLDFILLVSFVFFAFYSIHFSGVLSNYFSRRLKDMVIFDSLFKFIYFVGLYIGIHKNFK